MSPSQRTASVPTSSQPFSVRLGRDQLIDFVIGFVNPSQRPNLFALRLISKLNIEEKVLTPLGRDVGTDSGLSTKEQQLNPVPTCPNQVGRDALHAPHGNRPPADTGPRPEARTGQSDASGEVRR